VLNVSLARALRSTLRFLKEHRRLTAGRTLSLARALASLARSFAHSHSRRRHTAHTIAESIFERNIDLPESGERGDVSADSRRAAPKRRCRRRCARYLKPRLHDNTVFPLLDYYPSCVLRKFQSKSPRPVLCLSNLLNLFTNITFN